MRTSDFDYQLPVEKIAQVPIEKRDESRLMVLSRVDQTIEHRRFCEIGDFLHEGDVLVFNDSRVIPARLRATRETGGQVELLLLRRVEPGVWETLVKRAKRVSVGDCLQLSGKDGLGTQAEILEKRSEGVVVLRVSDEPLLEDLGEIPLPPYIHEPLKDPERYQTVYARVKGSAAAPTAGLHFTPQLLQKLRDKGVEFTFVTLHVGLGSFRPVRCENPSDHLMHQEYGEVEERTAQELNAARAEGRRIICVGTTAVRLVEHAALTAEGCDWVKPFVGWTRLFILPGFEFRVTDVMVTNFHLPRSTLLMLVAAFGGKDFILQAYEEAKNLDYRFYSFGDAMLIL